MNRFSDCEEYLEKVAGARHAVPVHEGTGIKKIVQRAFPSAYTPAGAGAASEVGATLKTPIGGIAGDIGALWRKLPGWGKALTGVGALGLGALGATGIIQAMGGDRPGDTLSYRINKGMFGLTDRIRADEIAGESFARGLGSAAAESLVGLTQDIVGKGYDTLKDSLGLSPVRKKIFGALKKEDPILADTDNKTLMEAYHTMASIAPNLSTDKNAVKSVLRMAATAGGGLDYNTIRGIAEAETSINKARESR